MEKRRPPNYWTKEKSFEALRKCKTLSQFQKQYRGAYKSLVKKNLLEEARKIVAPLVMPHGYYTEKKLFEISSKCKRLKDLRYNHPRAYDLIRHHPKRKEMTKHFIVEGNHSEKRATYIFIFENKTVYVGSTNNYKERYKDHVSRNPKIKNLIKKYNYKFIKKNDWSAPAKSLDNEQKWINYYKNKKYEVLNVHSAFSLGGRKKKWNKDNMKLVSKSYERRSDFRRDYPGIYDSARKLGIWDDICSHMPSQKKKNYWDEITLADEALKYKTRQDFNKNNASAFVIARKKGILNKICSHMPYDKNKARAKKTTGVHH